MQRGFCLESRIRYCQHFSKESFKLSQSLQGPKYNQILHKTQLGHNPKIDRHVFQILETPLAPQEGSEFKKSSYLTVCIAGAAALRPPEKDRKSINV